MGLCRDLESRSEELGFHFAEDRLMSERIPCAGPEWCGNMEQFLPRDGLCPAVEKHSTGGSLMSWWFDKVHFCLVWKWREPVSTWDHRLSRLLMVIVRFRFSLLEGSGGSDARIGFPARWLVDHGWPDGAGL